MPTDLWLSDEYGKLGATFVANTMLLDGVDLSNSETPDMTASLFPPAAGGADTADLGSNHNVIVDSHGNWVSMLHTGHGGAPGIFIDGVRATGSTARAATAGPGRRLVLPITGIIVAKDGKPWLAMGTPGSPPQPVTEVLVNIIDYGMHPKDAAAAPRFWAFRGGERRRSDRVPHLGRGPQGHEEERDRDHRSRGLQLAHRLHADHLDG